VLPTVAEVLDYEIEGGAYKGSSLLGGPRPTEERTLMFSCWNDSGCLASIKGSQKYIYHLDDEPEEIFDLSEDLAEQRNLAGERTTEELKERRSELLEWRARVNSTYGVQASK
jgi:hypothetical protein